MKRVLLIDDEVQVREAVAGLIARQGFEVAAARDGVEALRLHRRKRFDVIVADIVMPRKDGIETILELRTDSPVPGIIAISGGGTPRPSAFAEQLEALYALGVDRVLSKPFSGALLLACLDDVLNGRPRPKPALSA